MMIRDSRPAPCQPIDCGLANPGLLTHLLISKYGDYLPLYRQSEIYAREALIRTARRWVWLNGERLEWFVS